MADVKTIVVIDYSGNGYNVLYTLDGNTWISRISRKFGKLMNRAEMERYLTRLRQEEPQAQVVWQDDFYGRLPDFLVTEKTRII